MIDGANFVLWGSAGHAKVLADLIGLRGGLVVALFDNDAKASSALPGVPLHIGRTGFTAWVESQEGRGPFRGLAAIGGSRGADRLAIQNLFATFGLEVEPIVHPDASLSRTAELGAGTQVLAQAVVGANVRMGAACIVNHSATVDHECTLDAGVHVAPGATLCGYVKLGSHVLVGAGAVVLPRISVGPNSIIGAGTVVTRDLPENVVALGNPARIVRHVAHGSNADG